MSNIKKWVFIGKMLLAGLVFITSALNLFVGYESIWVAVNTLALLNIIELSEKGA
tara:strand:- start:268 stop:432 length:165 start_codon:yes stop_codon:yes gene_type:complete